jgi:hypothetical protein
MEPIRDLQVKIMAGDVLEAAEATGQTEKSVPTSRI